MSYEMGHIYRPRPVPLSPKNMVDVINQQRRRICTINQYGTQLLFYSLLSRAAHSTVGKDGVREP